MSECTFYSTCGCAGTSWCRPSSTGMIETHHGMTLIFRPFIYFSSSLALCKLVRNRAFCCFLEVLPEIPSGLAESTDPPSRRQDPEMAGIPTSPRLPPTPPHFWRPSSDAPLGLEVCGPSSAPHHSAFRAGMKSKHYRGPGDQN